MQYGVIVHRHEVSSVRKTRLDADGGSSVDQPVSAQRCRSLYDGGINGALADRRWVIQKLLIRKRGFGMTPAHTARGEYGVYNIRG